MKHPLIVIIVLVLLLIPVSGCSTTPQKKNNSSIALGIALNDSGVKRDIEKLGHYSSNVQPVDSNVTGYLNYTAGLYHVYIEAGFVPAVGRHDMIIDVGSGREVQTGGGFDVAVFPDWILVPGHATWYRRFTAENNGVYGAYIEVNQNRTDPSINPMLVDESNFNKIRQGLPFYGWSLYNLGENATRLLFSSNFSNAPIDTGLADIVAMPGKEALPGMTPYGRGVKLTFADKAACCYLILMNNGSTDSNAEMWILG